MDFREWGVVHDFVYIRNVRGTSIDDDRGSWIEHLRNKEIIRPRCIVINCIHAPQVGAHVELFDQMGNSKGIAIVPMCRSHNSEKENLGAKHPKNGRRVNNNYVVGKNNDYPALLMPLWRQQLIRIAEYMFDKELNQKTVDDIIYRFDRTDFLINGGDKSACKRCPD